MDKELEQYLLDTVQPGDALLLKGSNGMKLSAIASTLKDREA